MVVDLQVLVNIDDAINVGSLSLGEGVEVLTDADALVARVIFQAEEILEEAVPVAAVAAEPEVISKPKKEEGEDEQEKES